ncbi:MAG: AsmA family protein [Elusimicrobia bacterium]|nr:AsmA family protein [Elusimicrobiota bacterium]
MRLWRLLAVLAGALAVLVLAAALALRHFFPPERIKAVALAKLEAALGREVRIDSVSLGLRGLRLEGLEISEAPDFKAGVFVKAQSVLARWDLRALLRRRVAVSEVALEDFECNLVKDAQGRLNAATIGPSTKPGQAPAPKKASAPRAGAAAPQVGAAAAAGEKPVGGEFEISVRRVKLDGGAVTYKDASGTSVRLSALRASLKDPALGTEFPAELAFDFAAQPAAGKPRAAAAPTRGTAVEYRGSLDWRGKAKYGQDGSALLAFSPLKLRFFGLALSLDGKVERDAAGKVRLSVATKLPALVGERLRLLGVRAPDGFSVPAGALSADIEYAGDRVQLRPVTLTLGESTLQAKGTVLLSGAGKLDLSLAASALPLEAAFPVAPVLAVYGVRGKVSLDLRVTGPMSAPVLAGSGKVAGLSASTPGLALTNGAIEISFDPSQAKAKLTGKLGQGTLDIAVQALNYSKAPDLRVDGKLSALDLTAWAKQQAAAPTRGAAAPSPGSGPPTRGAAAPDPKAGEQKPDAAEAPKSAQPPLKTSGKLDIGPITHPNFRTQAAHLDWALTAVAPDLAKLSGRASLNVGAGALEDLSLLASKSQIARIALFPFVVLQKTVGLAKIPLLPGFDKVSFKEITGDYTFENGVMTVKESHMDSSAGYVTTTGSADLARDRLDLRIAAKVGGVAQGKIAGPLAFYVRGSMSSPEVKPDVAAILNQPIINQAVNQAVEQGKKLLKGLFK